MKKILLAVAITQIIASSALAMHHDKHKIPCRHDDYASRAPEKNRLLRQDTGLSWQNGLSFDIAEMLGGYLHSVGDKKNVRLVCKHWHQQFRHPGQSYGNGKFCRTKIAFKKNWFGYRKENLDQVIDRLVQRINNRPQPRPDDAIALKLRSNDISEIQDSDGALNQLFIILDEQNIAAIIKKIYLSKKAPESITKCRQLRSIDLFDGPHSAPEGLAFCAQLPQLQKIKASFYNNEWYLQDRKAIIMQALETGAQLSDCTNLQRLALNGSSVQFDVFTLFMLLDEHSTLKKVDVSIISSPAYDQEIYESAVSQGFIDNQDRYHSLTTLKIRNELLTPFSPFFLERLCYHAPNLKSLALIEVKKGLYSLSALHQLNNLSIKIAPTAGSSTAPLEELLQTGLPIKSLRIEDLHLITSPIPHQERFLPFNNLEELELYIDWAPRGIIDPTPTLEPLVAQCPQLKKLMVYQSTLRLTPGLIALLGRIATLQELSIKFYDPLSRETTLLLQTFAQQHSNIKVVFHSIKN